VLCHKKFAENNVSSDSPTKLKIRNPFTVRSDFKFELVGKLQRTRSFILAHYITMGDRAVRAKKSQFSLEGLKEARTGVSRLDQLEVRFFLAPVVIVISVVYLNVSPQLEDEGDVYEMVDEDEYEALVERRRNEDDFVVDDSKNPAASLHILV
jgi:hypothetical protein